VDDFDFILAVTPRGADATEAFARAGVLLFTPIFFSFLFSLFFTFYFLPFVVAFEVLPRYFFLFSPLHFY